MRYTTALLLLAFLPGCITMGNHLAELQAKKPAGDSFNEALAAEYLAYAEAQAEEEHPIRANYFAGKGLDALSGENVPLEEKPALEDSRKALLAVLTPDMKEIAPAKAARAQIMFDCWAEKEGVCKQGFADALSDLQFIADALVHGEDNHFTVPFAAKASALSPQGNSILDIVARRVKNLGQYDIEIHQPVKKARLSVLRELAVEKGLIARGVDAGRIRKNVKDKGGVVGLSTDAKKPNANSLTVIINTYGPTP